MNTVLFVWHPQKSQTIISLDEASAYVTYPVAATGFVKTIQRTQILAFDIRLFIGNGKFLHLLVGMALRRLCHR